VHQLLNLNLNTMCFVFFRGISIVSAATEYLRNFPSPQSIQPIKLNIVSSKPAFTNAFFLPRHAVILFFVLFVFFPARAIRSHDADTCAGASAGPPERHAAGDRRRRRVREDVHCRPARRGHGGDARPAADRDAVVYAQGG
jgi:hypothetical protein